MAPQTTKAKSEGVSLIWKVIVTALISVVVMMATGYFTFARNLVTQPEMTTAISNKTCEWVKDGPWVQKQINEIQAIQKATQNDVKNLQIQNSTQHATIMSELEHISKRLGP